MTAEFPGFMWVDSKDGALARLIHERTGTYWRLVKEGQSSFGLSDSELEQFEALGGTREQATAFLRPARPIKVEPFLMMEAPLPLGVAAPLLRKLDLLDRPSDFEDAADPRNRAYLTRAEADRVLQYWRWDYPTEAQWEYACRAGAQHSLFFFGTTIEGVNVRQFLLEPRRCKPNAWGFRALFGGEWCKDQFRATFEAKPLRNVFVTKGGGALFWPWQGNQEWRYCASAWRLGHKDTIDWLAVRPVISARDAEKRRDQPAVAARNDKPKPVALTMAQQATLKREAATARKAARDKNRKVTTPVASLSGRVKTGSKPRKSKKSPKKG